MPWHGSMACAPMTPFSWRRLLHAKTLVGALGVDVLLATFDRQLRKAAARSGLSTWPQ